MAGLLTELEEVQMALMDADGSAKKELKKRVKEVKKALHAAEGSTREYQDDAGSVSSVESPCMSPTAGLSPLGKGSQDEATDQLETARDMLIGIRPLTHELYCAVMLG